MAFSTFHFVIRNLRRRPFPSAPFLSSGFGSIVEFELPLESELELPLELELTIRSGSPRASAPDLSRAVKTSP